MVPFVLNIKLLNQIEKKTEEKRPLFRIQFRLNQHSKTQNQRTKCERLLKLLIGPQETRAFFSCWFFLQVLFLFPAQVLFLSQSYISITSAVTFRSLALSGKHAINKADLHGSDADDGGDYCSCPILFYHIYYT